MPQTTCSGIDWCCHHTGWMFFTNCIHTAEGIVTHVFFVEQSCSVALCLLTQQDVATVNCSGTIQGLLYASKCKNDKRNKKALAELQMHSSVAVACEGLVVAVALVNSICAQVSCWFIFHPGGAMLQMQSFTIPPLQFPSNTALSLSPWHLQTTALDRCSMLPPLKLVVCTWFDGKLSKIAIHSMSDDDNRGWGRREDWSVTKRCRRT